MNYEQKQIRGTGLNKFDLFASTIGDKKHAEILFLALPNHHFSSRLSLFLPLFVRVIPTSSAELAVNLPDRFRIVAKERHFVATYRAVIDSSFVFFAPHEVTAFTKDYISFHVPLPFWSQRFLVRINVSIAYSTLW